MTAPGQPTIEIELFAAMNHLYLRSSDAKAIPRSFHRRGCQDFEFRSTSEAVDTHNEDGIDILDIKPAEELGTQESKICCYFPEVCTIRKFNKALPYLSMIEVKNSYNFDLLKHRHETTTSYTRSTLGHWGGVPIQK